MNMSSTESDFDIDIIDQGNQTVYQLMTTPGAYLISFEMDTQIWLTYDYEFYRSMYGSLGSFDISYNKLGDIRNYYLPGPVAMPGKYRVIFQYNGYYYGEEILVTESGTDLVMVDCSGSRFYGKDG